MKQIFLELPCFVHDPKNVGNLVSGSFDSSKPSLYIWELLVQVLKLAWRILNITLLAWEMSTIVL